MIADSICCSVYSDFPSMKTRWSIAGALLFALVLGPFALRASARPMAASSCDQAKSQLRINPPGSRTGGTLIQLVASVPGHQAPTPRLHRNRGKKINIDGSAIPALQPVAATCYLAPGTSFVQLDPDGPNPSRGPPSQFSL